MTTSFPRQSARTRRFTLGAPRGVTVSPDGSSVIFLRSKSGADPVTCLWRLDPATGAERLLADPVALDIDERDLPAEERARRERARESAGGIVAYSTDEAVRTAAFTLGGQLFVADLATGAVRQLPAETPVFGPRLDPKGARVAYVSGRSLHVIDVASGADTVVARSESEQVSYGLAEFIAAEEMGRMRGFWWSPRGDALLVARVDETPVLRWHIADPAHPERPAQKVAYPAAGTPNAIVSLTIVTAEGEKKASVSWDRGMYPYLVTALWDGRGPLIVVQTRDQRSLRVLGVDPLNGETRMAHNAHDAAWLEIVAGVPARTGSGALVWTLDDDGTRRLTVGGEPVTPPGLQVRAVLDVTGSSVLFTASEEPTEIHVWEYTPEGLTRLTEGSGVFGAVRGGGTVVLSGTTLEATRSRTWVHGTDVTVANHAETPVITPKVELFAAGDRAIRTAVLLPSGFDPASGERLPVLVDPYGGPGAQRVLAAGRAFCEAQYLADQGFAVIVADNRGTPGRGPGWERAIAGDFCDVVLADQIAALHAAAERYPLDLSRVAIRGWSFGGFLAALAVLRRPDVFHAAVAGAPVTDWTLYDTHYTERYLGDPGEEPDVYKANSLIDDAPALERPLMLIHGLGDDNVVAAHTLRLSSALLAAGRPHTVLPLSGVTHMTPQEIVAENLLHLQVAFLRESLPPAP
ncbi:alpha/beta fold hydrolase [Actinocorallia sp. API 0066]|uniref:S9 family peptidase n=1 Tax=Actinocorallia sp. API 0066 TaxID=2896846 RepID=UPI001E2E239D|nr:alpha/beta fold hydrolase [Actinocorallia sp. API 0066]MCD0447940.1 alpha/beta fold hydrolase [Actinocorallia sp. API 0066]